MNINKILLSLILICLSVSAVFGFKLYQKSRVKPYNRVEARSKGPVSAPIQVVEHMDYQCHTCKSGTAKIEEYIAQNPDKIHLEIRFHFFDTRPAGRRAAIFAECVARQGFFWDYHKLLFDKQEDWAQSPDFLDDKLVGYARQVGANPDTLKACTDDLATLKTILDERNDGTLAGVQYTPTFFINNRVVVGPEALQKEMEPLLAAQKAS